MAERDDAYTEFVRSMAGTLRRTAYLVCGDWHRADDAVQDALYKLYLAWPRVHRTGNIQAYARRATVNAAIDTGRRPWRRETATAVLPDREVPDQAGDHADRDELLDALAGLGPRQRACLVLRFFDGLSIDQTAEILDCAPGTVKSQTSRGLNHLRDHLTRTRSASRVS
jgi:RNA polymerase sigma-70 factor (sigma-E family)